jgi:hypothetical protein
MSEEKFTVSSDQVVRKVKDLIREGSARHIRVIHKGKIILDLPLTVGAPAAAIGIIWAPFLAAIAAFGALVTECTIEVEKIDSPN